MTTKAITHDGVTVECNVAEADLVRAIIDAADGEGTIQADDMVILFPGEPTRHTTTQLSTALDYLGARLID